MSLSKILSFADPSSITSIGITLMLMLMGFIFFFYSMTSSSNSAAPKKENSSSNSSEPKTMVSTSTSSIQNRFQYDVFLSFRGEDTRKNFVDHLYEALKDKSIYTYKDDEKIQKGERISDDLFQSIENSKFYIIVFSINYVSSAWCLEELVKIMECQKIPGHTAYPVFYDVKPTEVRKQSGAVKKAFFNNKKKEAAKKWKGALKEAADLAGWGLENTLDGHEAKFIKKIVQEISLQLRCINFGFDEKLVGMETRVKDVVSSLEVGIDEVRMIGIKGMGGAGKTTTTRAVFDHLSNDFEATSFVENVREVSNASKFGLKKLQEQVLSKVLNEHVTLETVNEGKNMMNRRMCGKKILLVLDDVDHIQQLEALAREPKSFKAGSRIIITTRDEQVLVAHRVNLIRDINLLLDNEAICLFSRHAFGRENPLQGYEELSRKVVHYAAGLPLTIKVLGSFLCGKDEHEWKDALKRLRTIPLKETLEKLKISYMGLEEDYKNIFLDIACMLKGERREYAIEVLECCGFYARNGLKVLEQRSLITISKDKELCMHDHIEEMGKNIVRCSHPNEPNKHSHLWIDKEVEDILANDMGTEETSCLKLDIPGGWNPRIVLKGLGKMKKLRYLDVSFPIEYMFYHKYMKSSIRPRFREASQYFTNSLKYLKCRDYPFLYLPKTFQATNLVGLEFRNTTMVQLWEEGEKKVLKKLKFLSLTNSKLTTFDFTIAPNLETLSLKESIHLAELFMPVLCQKLKHLNVSYSDLRNIDLGLTPNLETLSLEVSDKLVELSMPVCCQKLKHLDASHSKLRTFDLGLTPNLQTLSLDNCAHFEELHVSAACPNLKFLNLRCSSLRSLDLELFPNLERLDLRGCNKLVEINAPIGCLRKLVQLDLNGCLWFTDFVFRGRWEPKVDCSSATLDLVGESLDLCPLHPNSNLPKLQFRCYYDEHLPSSVGNIEKLMSYGQCCCTDVKKFSDMVCSLRCLKKLKLQCSIPEFPKDLGRLECLEELNLSSTTIKQLSDSICMLKRLKYLEVNNGDLLEKLPEGLGQLECLERLHVRSKKIKFLPDSICMLKRLKYLILDRCALLEKLPEDLGLLECLKVIVITNTGIRHLPESIFGLKGLLIVASLELLQLYSFRSEIQTKTPSIWQEAKFTKRNVEEISLELRCINFGFDEKLVGMESRVKDVVSSLEVGIDEVRMIGIKGMGGAGKTTTARAVFDHLSADFESKSFVGNVREVSKASIFGLKNLLEQVLSNVLNEQVTLNSVDDGKNMMKSRMCGVKVLLVLDDVDHIEQLEALAGDPNWFKPGSRIIITTRDEQVLVAHRVKVIRDIDLLSDMEAICLFSRYAFGRGNPVQEYEEVSRKAVRYAGGHPFTIKVLGSFLCGKDEHEWKDALKRLRAIPLKETLEKLELSYDSLSIGFIV